MEDWLKQVKDEWNQTADSEWYRSLRTDERIEGLVRDPSSAFHPAVYDLIRKYTPDLTDRKILLPSSGDNHAAFAFALSGAEVTSSDISEKQLEYASAIAEKLNLKMDFVCDNTMELSNIKSDAYDLVFTSNGTHSWIPDLGMMYHNICRVLKPGGYSVMYDRANIGFIAETKDNDFYRLCEYFNYHSGEVFVIKTQQDKEAVFIACADYLASVAPDGRMNYSGLYVRELGQNGQEYKITEESLPKEITLGKMIFPKTQGIQFTFAKVKKVFEDGRFVGPSIAEEDALDY